MSKTRIVRQSKLQWIHLDDLRVDPAAQRELNENWVARRVDAFDPDKLGLIVVNIRNGDGTYVIDGQHRKELVREALGPDQQMQCEVYDGLTADEEAQVFLDRNDRLSVRTLDKFRIRVTAGDPVAVAIDRIVRAHGLVVATSRDEGTVSAVRSLELIYTGAHLDEKAGPEALDRTLRLLLEAWGEGTGAFQGKILEGVGLVVLRYGDDVDDARMVKVLAGMPGGPDRLLGRGKTVRELRGGNLGKCMAAAVVDLYNRGRRAKRLPDWWTG